VVNERWRATEQGAPPERLTTEITEITEMNSSVGSVVSVVYLRPTAHAAAMRARAVRGTSARIS
jgi:hypothetical protein